MNRSDWITWGAIGIAIILLFWGLVRELPYIMNYLEVGRFWGLSLLIGTALATGLAYLLVIRRQLSIGTDGLDNYRRIAAIGFACWLSTPLIMSTINRSLVSLTVPTPVIFNAEEARFSSRFGERPGPGQAANQHLLFFEYQHQLHRISWDGPARFPEASAGDTITLSIGHGALGFEWVDND